MQKQNEKQKQNERQKQNEKQNENEAEVLLPCGRRLRVFQCEFEF